MKNEFSWRDDRFYFQSKKLNDAVNRKNWKMAVIEVGAGETVSPVRTFSESYAEKYKASLIRINPIESFSKDDSIIYIKMIEQEGLEAIDKLMLEN